MNIDKALEELGSWGKFQMIIYCFMAVDVVFFALNNFNYVFTAGVVPHRCLIPECDTGAQPAYLEPWLSSAVPFTGNNTPSSCQRFPAAVNATYNSCTSTDSFLTNKTMQCSRWVYNHSESTIASEFGLSCEEEWKRTMVGSVRSFGMFVGLPLSGIASDKFGRKRLLVTSLCLTGILGLARSFAWSYISFVAFEFLDAAVGSGIFPTSVILGMELLSPRKRVVGGASLFMIFSAGEASLGFIAMFVKHWRQLLRIIYCPYFIFISYIWMIPESVRWLASQGRDDDAILILRKAATRNGVVLSESVLGKTELNNLYIEDMGSKDVKSKKKESLRSVLMQVVRSRILLLRFLTCCYCWLTNNFVYYGITLNSVVMKGNKYTNFILTALIEIPGSIIGMYSLKVLGRRMTLAGSLGLSGACLLVFCFVPPGMWSIQMALYLLGKMLVTLSFTSTYMYTAEMFPTPVRLSVSNFCSMFGRVGYMIVPHTPLLARYMESLPLLVLGVMAATAGGLALCFPETLGVQLPDTVAQAEHIGRGQPRNPGESAASTDPGAGSGVRKY